VHDPEGQTTFCPGCGAAVIERDWMSVRAYRLAPGGKCRACGTAIAGRFDSRPVEPTSGRRFYLGL
jgi:pyruvate formate lyase activating enzyme